MYIQIILAVESTILKRATILSNVQVQVYSITSWEGEPDSSKPKTMINWVVYFCETTSNRKIGAIIYLDLMRKLYVYITC